MEISLRQIAVSDVQQIAELSHQLGYEISATQMFQNIEAVLQHADCDAFVAVHNNRVVGWIGLAYRLQLESPPLCEINGLVIHETYRGQGIGKMLIEKAKSWSTSKKTHCLRLRTNINRKDAHRFYSALGFKEVKQQKVFELTL